MASKCFLKLRVAGFLTPEVNLPTLYHFHIILLKISGRFLNLSSEGNVNHLFWQGFER